MVIEYQGKAYCSRDISPYEAAWKIEETPMILDFFASQGKMILGGDILTQDLQYTYDNWYYQENPNKTKSKNVKDSNLSAQEYILKYIRSHGAAYHVVIVVS